MIKLFFVIAALTLLAACDGQYDPPVDLSNAVKEGTVNIDGERITVFRQEGKKWAAYGGDKSKDPQRFIAYRKERAIELKSHCRIDKRLSGPKDHILVATVKC